MKTVITLCTALFLTFTTSTRVHAQKKVQHFKVEKTLDLSANAVWKVVGQDYGAIVHSHPKIVNSEYTSGSLKASEGAERMCYFNEKETKFLHEKMIDYDPANMSFTNTVLAVGKFPLNQDYTTAVYKVTPLGDQKCKISIDMKFRTKPAFMGGMAKGSFINLLKDYFVAVEHHVKTGENVTKDNFKEIKKIYPSEAVVTKF